MLLNEIFDTSNQVTWQHDGNSHLGSFSIDGEEYSIEVEEYTLNLPSEQKTVIDVGFRKGNSSALTGDQKPARVLGSVLAGLKSIIAELQPNVVMFGAMTANGAVEQRLAIYSRAASMIAKNSVYHYKSKWYQLSLGKYMFLSDFTPTLDDEETIDRLAAYTK